MIVGLLRAGSAVAAFGVLVGFAPAGVAQDKRPISVGAPIEKAIGLARAGEPDRAVELLRPFAERGDTEAQFNIGLLHEFALKTPAEAALWYRRAAVGGHPEAENNLGALYFEGRGVQRSLPEALRWYRASAEREHPPAQYNLGLMIGRGQGVDRADPVEMVRWMTRSAAAGYDRAQAQLGRLYLDGVGVEANPKTAVEWFRKSAEQGNAWGQFYYGFQLKRGEGVPRDLQASAQWFERAAKQKHVLATHELAIAYEMGLGVAQDAKRALGLYREAGEMNHRPAIERLANVYVRGGLGTNGDAKEARYWGRKLNEAARTRPPEI